MPRTSQINFELYSTPYQLKLMLVYKQYLHIQANIVNFVPGLVLRTPPQQRQALINPWHKRRRVTVVVLCVCVCVWLLPR